MHLKICELGPRDGLQVFRKFVPTGLKVDLIDSITLSGIKEIHLTYFAHPKVICQTKDAEEVAKKVKRKPDVDYIGFIPNEVGLRRAVYAGVDRISFFISMEDSYNLSYFHTTFSILLDHFLKITKEALYEKLLVEVFIVRAFEKKFQKKAIETAIRFINTGVKYVYFSNFGHDITSRELKNFFKLAFRTIGSKEIGLHLYSPISCMNSLILGAFEVGIQRYATSIGGLGPRLIEGKIVTLIPTELLIKMAYENAFIRGRNSYKLEKPLKIVSEIEKIVEKVGKL